MLDLIWAVRCQKISLGYCFTFIFFFPELGRLAICRQGKRDRLLFIGIVMVLLIRLDVIKKLAKCVLKGC